VIGYNSYTKRGLLANGATPQTTFTVHLQIRVEIKTLQIHHSNRLLASWWPK